jgi:hypothetical protein
MHGPTCLLLEGTAINGANQTNPDGCEPKNDLRFTASRRVVFLFTAVKDYLQTMNLVRERARAKARVAEHVGDGYFMYLTIVKGLYAGV